jgi:threonine/homoserine/homoserine lactone efflux protein
VTHFSAYLAIAVLVIVTPGQDTALVIRNTLVGGRRAGVWTTIGVVAGQATWALATSAGVAALLLASEPLFAALRLAGAAYLVVLGAQALYGAWVHGRARGDAIDGRSQRGITPRVALRQGLISNLGNPKVAVFFTSLLPQFAPPHRASFSALLFLGLVFCSVTLVWLTGYSFAVERFGDVLRRARIRRATEGLLGAVLVALGVRLALERR